MSQAIPYNQELMPLQIIFTKIKDFVDKKATLNVKAKEIRYRLRMVHYRENGAGQRKRIVRHFNKSLNLQEATKIIKELY